MKKLRLVRQNQEDLFSERYQNLLRWAMQLTDHDKEKAEDLVHDAFVQWTLYHPPVDSIENFDGYLYRMLRNLHVSTWAYQLTLIVNQRME